MYRHKDQTGHAELQAERYGQKAGASLATILLYLEVELGSQLQLSQKRQETMLPATGTIVLGMDRQRRRCWCVSFWGR